jgi:hypothetical protein
MPFDEDSIVDADVRDNLQSHYLCKNGLQLVMGVGNWQWFCIC